MRLRLVVSDHLMYPVQKHVDRNKAVIGPARPAAKTEICRPEPGPGPPSLGPARPEPKNEFFRPEPGPARARPARPAGSGRA